MTFIPAAAWNQMAQGRCGPAKRYQASVSSLQAVGWLLVAQAAKAVGRYAARRSPSHPVPLVCLCCRVCLARAAYHPADIVLLDNPLSAVDQHTALHIFNYCIKGELEGLGAWLRVGSCFSQHLSQVHLSGSEQLPTHLKFSHILYPLLTRRSAQGQGCAVDHPPAGAAAQLHQHCRD